MEDLSAELRAALAELPQQREGRPRLVYDGHFNELLTGWEVVELTQCPCNGICTNVGRVRSVLAVPFTDGLVELLHSHISHYRYTQ